MKLATYLQAVSIIEVGMPALIITPETPPGRVTITTPVVAYDEIAESFQTLNTTYILENEKLFRPNRSLTPGV